MEGILDNITNTLYENYTSIIRFEFLMKCTDVKALEKESYPQKNYSTCSARTLHMLLPSVSPGTA